MCECVCVCECVYGGGYVKTKCLTELLFFLHGLVLIDFCLYCFALFSVFVLLHAVMVIVI